MSKNNRKVGFIFIFLLALLLLLLIVVGRIGPSTSQYKVTQNDFVNPHVILQDIAKTNLTTQEITGLQTMREEEKLAKDVYTAMGRIWGMKIFSNIASSEQTHTESVKYLLDRYGIEDPVTDNSIGAFSLPKYQELYKQSTEQGSNSLLDALTVGAKIEDLDIYDLSVLLNNTQSEDIKVVYQNLQRGSRNHLRAYVSQIQRNGGTYSPEYISQEEYNSIISSKQETGTPSF